MEGDQRKQQRFTKRRERVHSKLDPDGGKDEMDSSPSRSDSDKPRAKPPRRRRNRSHSHDEDIIDGFAILSFKSLEDLNNLMKPSKTIEQKDKKNDFVKRKKKKTRIKPCRPLSPALNHRFSDNSSVHSPYSDRTEEFSDQRSGCRDGGLSDVSTHSSSGRGYLCDSESGDERASNASSDLFSTLNHNRECPAPSTTSCSSPCSTPITSTASSQTDSGITTATVTTTTAVSAYTTATETNPTASTTTTTSCTVGTTTTNSSVIANGPLITSKEKPRSPISSKPVDSRSPHLKKPFPRASSDTLLHKDQHKFSPSPVRTPRREDPRSDKDFPLPPSFGFSKPWHSGSTPHLHNPYTPVTHSPGIPQFGLHSSTAGHSSSFSSLPPSPLHNLLPPPGPQSMFAAPLPPGAANGSLTSPHTIGGAGLSAHASPESMSLASQEILREELNRRFLAAQERTSLPVIGSTPYGRADIHQHQHMHQHQHQHQHTHQHMFALPGLTGSLVPSPAPHLYDKVPKPFESSFYRATPGLLGYPMVPPLVHSGSSLNSSSSGAFQPKKVAGGLLHPGQLIPTLREQEKVPPSAASLPHHKKSGKWCTMHVQIAWKIHRHQQESSEVSKGGEGKSLDPLQSGRNLSSSSLHRPTDLSTPSSLLGMSSFPRPSPYPFSSHEGFGGLGRGGSPFGTPGREIPKIPGIASPQEWSRLHRSSPLFSGSHWSKPDEREREIEKEKEREKEREVVLGLDRRREERERERRSSDRERRGSVDLEQSKDRPFIGGDVRHPHTISSHSRSRSRSPLVGGRVGSAKSDSSYNRDEKDIIKVKEEKVDEPEVSALDRDKFRPDYLLGASNLMDRSRLLGGPSQFPFGADRIPPPQSLWGSQEKSLMDFTSYHSLQFQREMEQERERMLRRLQPPSVGLYDPERVRKDEILLQEERLRREYFDRLPQFERERFEREKLALESSRLGHSRHFDPLRASGHFPRTMSPLVSHSGLKVGSPALLQGPPPPLIPSSSTPTNRSHSNSPAMTKLKLPSNSDLDKRDSYSSSNLDGHGR
ncbi:autism susceptibility gene 2 protein-like isoform X2 [Saccostrea echinata]|uniref:autism susceptibility gene 2 protein-like isoform X2 n=1 Tax=Saccostrea echinata TaxID=191078 RepID=UPI002A80DA6C|nr:autism susceptibility gene 2 protein-like isoform X2 [Saccostrea echinata]